MEKEVIIGNSLSEIIHVTNFIKDLGASLQLSNEMTMSVNVALEEAIANVIKYAFNESEQHDIRLKVKIEPQKMTFNLMDDGISFYEALDDEVGLTQEQAFLKKLGTKLIREIMDEVSYCTVDGQNLLVMVKKMNIEIKNEKTMHTNICKIEGVTIITIDGRLDTVNSHEFEQTFFPLLEESNLNLIINCENFLYISSSGIRSFIMMLKNVTKNNGTLVFEAMRPEIRKIFDMTGCSSLFTIR